MTINNGMALEQNRTEAANHQANVLGAVVSEVVALSRIATALERATTGTASVQTVNLCPLRWTHEPPKVAGLYLFRNWTELSGLGKWGVAGVYHHEDGGFISTLVACQFCGPLVIAEPEETT